MMNVYLHGSLSKKYGKHFLFEASTINDAICALRANFPDFFATIKDGWFRIIVGSLKSGLNLAENELDGFKVGSKNLHIVPVIKGAKDSSGWVKIAAGIALVGLAMVPGLGMGAILWGTTSIGSIVGSMGVSLVMTGVATLIAPELKKPDLNEKESYTSSGPTITTREGGIIPIAYGEVITGGTMIHGEINITKA